MEKICSLCKSAFEAELAHDDVCPDCLNFNQFATLVQDQFTYGGKKYGINGNSKRESTDMLFDKHGKNWLIGTIDKYTFRFTNLARERDLLKIACYMYIMWLKRGFHVRDDGINDPPLDTNIQQKQDNFGTFLHKAIEYNVTYRLNAFGSAMIKLAKSETDNLCYLSAISEMLGTLSNTDWKNIKEKDLLMIFDNSFLTWVTRYANIDTHDTDTAKK